MNATIKDQAITNDYRLFVTILNDLGVAKTFGFWKCDLLQDSAQLLSRYKCWTSCFGGAKILQTKIDEGNLLRQVARPVSSKPGLPFLLDEETTAALKRWSAAHELRGVWEALDMFEYDAQDEAKFSQGSDVLTAVTRLVINLFTTLLKNINISQSWESPLGYRDGHILG